SFSPIQRRAIFEKLKMKSIKKSLALYFRSMVSICTLTSSDATLLAEIGKVSLLESHGHSAAPEVMQEYVNENFTVEACRQELSDEASVFQGLFYNDEPAGYSKIQFNYLQPLTDLKQV